MCVDVGTLDSNEKVTSTDLVAVVVGRRKDLGGVRWCCAMQVYLLTRAL